MRPRLAVATLCALVACAGEGARPSEPRRERLAIVSEVPGFVGRGPFESVRPAGWQEATVLADGRSVEIRYWSGNPACYGADHAQAVYEERRIVLTLFEGRTSGICTAERVTHTATVRLSEPVDDREIVDGAPPARGP